MSSLHYDAFISYRHNPRDSAVAKELQKSLERFVIPKSIRESYHKDKIERVFRDEEELNIGADLSEKITDAINNSDFLIVVCSKAYKESKWCLLEIETFLKTHSYDQVLCVLSEGEPPTIFPDILLKESEPLACDYRLDFKEAKRTQLPKLVSTMIGCQYDELMLRQERYRRKRLMSLITIIMALAIIAISYLLYSNARIKENYNNSLRNESKLLAKQSLDYFEEKDRLSALNVALNALPSNELNRPITDEAIYALNKATYAYSTPYDFIETYRIDLSSDITDYFISADNEYLVYLDNNNCVYTLKIDTHELINSFNLPSGNLSKIHEGKAGQLVTYSNGKVYAYDYLSGELVFDLELKYQSIGITHLSNDKKLIGAADSWAIQIMNTEGVPQMSLPLPEDYNGYIVDLKWSKDDKYIAVKLRDFEYGYQIGVFDLNDYKFHLLDLNKLNVEYFAFDDLNNLHVVSSNNKSQTMILSETKMIIDNTYYYSLFNPFEKVFESEIIDNSEVSYIEAFRLDNYNVLAIGSNVYKIDDTGKVINEYRFDSPIKSVLSHNEEFIDVLCEDGFLGSLFMNGYISLVKTFPVGVDRIDSLTSKDNQINRYIVLNNNNLMLFENYYDSSIEYLGDESFSYESDEYLRLDDKAMMKSDNTILFINLLDNKIQTKYEIEEGEYYHLLDIIEDSAYLLNINNVGKYRIVEVDFNTGKIIDENVLDISDYYISNGLLDYPLNRQERLYLDRYYTNSSIFVCKNHKVYINNYIYGNVISVYDLVTRNVEELNIDLTDNVLISVGAYNYPSEMLVSDDGKYILSKQSDINTLKQSYVLININDKNSITLDCLPSEGFVGDISDKVVVSSQDGIYTYDLNGNLLETISYNSLIATSIKYHDGKIYAIYPDGNLYIYKDTNVIRQINLGNVSYYDYKSYNYKFNDNHLYLFSGNSLNVINLESDSTTPVYNISGSVLDYLENDKRILVFSYEPNKNDYKYRIAYYKEYEVNDLINLAHNQLNEYQ